MDSIKEKNKSEGLMEPRKSQKKNLLLSIILAV